MRIGVYAILSDETGIDEWIEVTQTADARLVVDCGVADATRLRQAGVTIHEVVIEPWRDDDALNTALALLPADIDVCFRIDIQDHPPHGWRQMIETAWKPDTQRLRHPYRNPPKCHYEHRVHRHEGFRWSGPWYPTLHWRQQGVCMTETSDALIVDYAAQDWNDLALLREGAEEARRDDPQRTFFLATGLLREGYLQEGLAEVYRYIAQIGPGDMVAYLWRQVALADEANAFQHLLEAQRAHQCASNYLAFAEQYLLNQEWGQCYSACQYAISLLRSNPQPVLAWSDDKRLRGPLLHDLAATAAWNLWDFEAAYGHAVEALRRAPSDVVLSRQVAAIRAKIQAGATLNPDLDNQPQIRLVKLQRANPEAAQEPSVTEQAL